MEFYSEQDLQKNATQLRSTLLAIGVPSLLFAAALVYSLIVRVEWLTTLVTLLWGGLLLFLWDMKLAPVLAYRKHLNGILGGLRREVEGRVVSFSEEGIFQEGVFFNEMIVNCDPNMDPEGERLFYVDRCKAAPAIVPGDCVRVASNGKYMTSWEKRDG